MSTATMIEEYMPEVPVGDTRRFQITIRDGNGNLADPDWVRLALVKAGAIESPIGPYDATRVSIGIYFVYFSFPKGCTLGDWIREWTWEFNVPAGRLPGKYSSYMKLVDKAKKVSTWF
jgi:hypothetical protein